MNQDKPFKYSILSGIIVAIIMIIFIQPILTLIWNLLSSLGGNILKSLFDHIYENASLGKRDFVSNIIFTLFCSTIIAFILAYYTKGYIMGKDGLKSKILSLKSKNILNRLQKFFFCPYCFVYY